MVVRRPTLQQLYNTVSLLLVTTLIILTVCARAKDRDKVRDIVAVASLLGNETASGACDLIRGELLDEVYRTAFNCSCPIQCNDRYG